MDSNSLAHTRWNCKYHIVFTPKYRRQIIYKRNQLQEDIATDQISLKEFTDPFTGEPVSKGK